MNKQTVEISWINSVKALCIVFIFLNHCEFYCGCEIGILRNLYLPFFTNAFFFVSGYLFFKKQLSECYKKLSLSEWLIIPGGGKSLLNNILFKIAIPTVLFSIITYIPKLYIRDEGFSMIELLSRVFLDGNYWFTCALVVAELLLTISLFSRVKNIWFYYVLSVLLTIVAQVILNSDIIILHNTSWPWYYKSGFCATIFLATGGVYQRYEDKIDKFFTFFFLTLLVITVSIVALFHYPTNNILSRGSLGFSGYVLDILFCYAVIRLSKLFPVYSLINYIGRHSIGFYFICGALPNIIVIFFSRVGIASSVWNTMLSTIVSLIMAFPIVYLFNKYLPFLFDLRVLNKKKR